MGNKGKCPSLITGNHGKPVFEVAERKRTCKRCSEAILKGVKCVCVPIPSTMGSRTYCCNCLTEIIAQSRNDLSKLEEEL